MKILDMLHEINFNGVNFPLFMINSFIEKKYSGKFDCKERTEYESLVAEASNFVSAKDIESKRKYLVRYSESLLIFASEDEFLYKIQEELSRITGVTII